MNNHGGKRLGSGKKPAIYGLTKPIRVPLGCLEKVLEIVQAFKNGFVNK